MTGSAAFENPGCSTPPSVSELCTRIDPINVPTTTRPGPRVISATSGEELSLNTQRTTRYALRRPDTCRSSGSEVRERHVPSNLPRLARRRGTGTDQFVVALDLEQVERGETT